MSTSIPAKCTTTTNGPVVVCEERGRKMIFRNRARSNVQKIRVDGCVLCQTKACDFLVIGGSSEEHFIELKGRNVEHALEQLAATIPILRKSSDTTVYAWVISSESPSTQSRFQIQKVRFIKALRAKLTIRTNQATHDLS